VGRSHDHYCPDCKCWWSPFDFPRCPGDHPEDRSEYDLNHDAEQGTADATSHEGDQECA
jgi:hypothetical protein